jgi:hypothetical protein
MSLGRLLAISDVRAFPSAGVAADADDLLLATSKSPVGRETRTCVRAHAGMADGSGVIVVFV